MIKNNKIKNWNNFFYETYIKNEEIVEYKELFFHKDTLSVISLHDSQDDAFSLITVFPDRRVLLSYLSYNEKKYSVGDFEISELLKTFESGFIRISFVKNRDDFTNYVLDLNSLNEANVIPFFYAQDIGIEILNIRDCDIEDIISLALPDLTPFEVGEEEVREMFNEVSEKIRYVKVLNVGQGNLNIAMGSSFFTELHLHAGVMFPCLKSLRSRVEEPLFYYDLGAGYTRISKALKTRRRKLSFEKNQKIIISHWDLDHFIQLYFYLDACGSVLAPKHKGASQLYVYVVHELISREKLKNWGEQVTIIKMKNLVIFKSQGNNINNSGLVLNINFENYLYQGKILLPGDVPYAKIPRDLKDKVFGLVACHHGGKSYSSAVDYPTPLSTHLLVYSYGDKAGFPRNEEVNNHKVQSWRRSVKTQDGDFDIGLLYKKEVYFSWLIIFILSWFYLI